MRAENYRPAARKALSPFAGKFRKHPTLQYITTILLIYFDFFRFRCYSITEKKPNPKNSGEKKMAAKVDSSKCVGCEACVGACPVSAIEMKDGVAVVKESDCIDCGACVGECPSEAISL